MAKPRTALAIVAAAARVAAVPDATPAPPLDPTIAALLREREGYRARGKSNRAAAVDDELARLGYKG